MRKGTEGSCFVIHLPYLYTHTPYGSCRSLLYLMIDDEQSILLPSGNRVIDIRASDALVNGAGTRYVPMNYQTRRDRSSKVRVRHMKRKRIDVASRSFNQFAILRHLPVGDLKHSSCPSSTVEPSIGKYSSHTQ